jgi:hypothetical protein
MWTDGQTERQTDMTKLTVAFSQFCESAQKSKLDPVYAMKVYSGSADTDTIIPNLSTRWR